MRDLLAVIVGALVGSGVRLGVDTVVPHSDAQFPVSTLVINLLGSLVLGYLVARVWPSARSWLKAGMGVGLLGSFTTFSAFAVSLVSLITAGRPGLAVAYLLATLVGGAGAAFAGLAVGRLDTGARRPARIDLEDE